MEDDVGLASDFDNTHLTKRFRNAVVAGNVVISDLPLQRNSLEALGAHVGINIDDVIQRGLRDRQKFHMVYLFMEKLSSLGTALESHCGLPQQLRSVAHDVCLLGRLLHIWFQAMFNMYLEVAHALVKYLTFYMAVFFLQKEGNSFNKA